MSPTASHTPPSHPLELNRCFPAMTTTIELRIRPRDGQEQAAARALARAEQFLRSAEQRLSRFLPESEIGRLNQGYRGPFSRQTLQLVATALEAAEATGGLFDPSVLAALEAAGYDRTISQVRSDVRATAHRPAPMLGAFRNITVDPVSRTIEIPPRVGLDLGGIAKGWLADAVVRTLARYGPALADLGGDIAVGGMPTTEASWALEVEDPFGGQKPLAVIRLTEGGVATSGTIRRRWQTADGWQHHLTAPRPGRPAVTDLTAVTIVAPSATAAEIAAKATLLLGAKAGLSALEHSPDLAGLLVQNDGSLVTTAALQGYPIETENGND